MEFIQNLESKVVSYCGIANDFITSKIGVDLNIHEHCAFLEEANNFVFEAILIGIFLFFALIIYFLTKQSGKSSKIFQAKLVNIKEISHDTKIFTFDLPSGQNKIGLNIGEHLELEAQINGETVARKYTPISRADVKRNSFELLIKIYYKQPPQWPNGGIMSQHIDSLKIGDFIKVTLPYGRFNYLGKSNVQIKELNGSIRRNKVDHIYMVGGGTGITPLYQIIQYVTEAEQAQDRPALSLLFANRTQDDILVKNELEAFQKQNETFKCYFSVDRSIKEGWNGLVGFIDEAKISKLVGDNKLDNSLFVVCGPPILCNIIEKILLTKYKLNPQQFFRF